MSLWSAVEEFYCISACHFQLLLVSSTHKLNSFLTSLLLRFSSAPRSQLESSNTPKRSAMLVETRKAPRTPLSIAVRVFKGAKILWRDARGVDISPRGIRLSLPEPIQKGTQIGMTFSMPGDTQKIRIDGRVVWGGQHEDASRASECGIQFDRLKKTEASHEHSLHFMGDRMCNFILKLTPADLVARPARSLSEIRKAFRLIYKEYLSLGYCQPNKAKMHYSAYILLPGSRTFILKKNKHLLGTVSLVEDSSWGLPMEINFPHLFKGLRRQGRKLVEVSLLTLNRQAFKESRFTLTDSRKMTGSFWLFKSMLDYARHSSGVSDLLITVHPKHEKLYRNFAFVPLGKPSRYNGAQGNPGLPMHLDVTHLERYLPKEKSFRKFFFDQPVSKISRDRSFKWSSEALAEFHTNEGL